MTPPATRWARSAPSRPPATGSMPAARPDGSRRSRSTPRRGGAPVTNALGQQVSRAVGSGPSVVVTLSVHDLAGNRIAEHDDTGAVIREYIWLDGPEFQREVQHAVGGDCGVGRTRGWQHPVRPHRPAPRKTSQEPKKPFTDPVREVRVRTESGKILRILCNDLDAGADEIAALYKRRWAIELFPDRAGDRPSAGSSKP